MIWKDDDFAGDRRRHSTDEGVPPDGDKVVHGRGTAHVYVVLDPYVTGELNIVCDDAPIADVAIVRNVCAD